MKLLQQILFLLLAWFANTVNAKSVFIKTNVPNYEFSFLKTENQRLESEVKICVSNFARSSLSENLFSCSAFIGVAWKGVAGRFTNKQTELGVNLLQNKEMIVKECGFKYIQPEGR